MKLITIILLFLTLNVYGQRSATVKTSVGACIVNINDTLPKKDVVIPVIENGMTYRFIMDNFNKPNKIITMRNNKMKFIYDDYFIYFNNGVVDIINKRKDDSNI